MHLPKFFLILLVSILALLTACRGTSPDKQETPNLPAQTPVSTYTPTVQTLPTSTISPSATTRPSPTPGKQLYVDPEERYQVELPVDWLPGAQPGLFTGSDGYFQAGDLPEMGFYSHADQVCMRLVQALNEPAAPLLTPFFAKIDSCQVVPIPKQNPNWTRAVIKAPGMPPEKRYFYFESDGAHMAGIAATFKMLEPTSPDDIYSFPSGPLRPADHAFWDTQRQPAAGMPLTETRLAALAGDSPANNFQFAGYVPRELWLRGMPSKPTLIGNPLANANQVLARFGYELRQTSTMEAGPYELYQDGKRIRGQILTWQAPTLSASGGDFALSFVSINGQEVLRSGGLEQWKKEYGGPEVSFRFLGEDLLGLFWNSQYSSIDVLKENQILYRFGTLFGANSGLETFQIWQNHWLLEVRGFLIQDGVMLNDQLGYEEIFDWQLLNGKPFYFFRKVPRVGISYDGQVQPVYYDDVAHYLCCGFAGMNPFNNGAMISFFAQRDGVWYFVQMGS